MHLLVPCAKRPRSPEARCARRRLARLTLVVLLSALMTLLAGCDFPGSSPSPSPVGGGNPSALGNGPHIVTPTHPTDDLVVATQVATAAPYKADPKGVQDATAAIQQALTDCHTPGGGVVWLPAGTYKVTSSIYVPPHCTLRGDWRDPDVGVGEYGTVILAAVPSGDATAPGLFRVSGSAGVNGLTVYYPNQSATTPTPYPFTFEILGTLISGAGFMMASVERVTLLDSYLGISTGVHTDHELHTIRDVKGSVLMTGLYLQDCSDISRTENVTFNSSYWASLSASVAPTKPSADQITAWTRAHATGMEMGGLDWDQFINLSFSDFYLGIALIPGRRAPMTASLEGIKITNSHIALYVPSPNVFPGFGLNVANSTLQANQTVAGAKPVAIDVFGDNHPVSLLFTNVTIGGGAYTGALIGGDVYAGFLNCTFDDWSGPAALIASRGTVAIEGSTFVPTLSAAKRGILLQPGLSSATILGNSFAGDPAALVGDTSGAGPARVIRQDAGFAFVKNQLPPYAFHPLPRPASLHFYNARIAPYNAKGNGSGDDTAPIQKALDDAGKAGGGTVYLPAGIYAVHGHLSVPAGVELRGSDDRPHRGMVLDGAPGTILFAYEGKGTATPDAATPFILLNGSHAGVRGLSVNYPEQVADSPDHIAAYPWTIRGKGTGVYAFDIAFVNAYQGIDFATSTTDGHYIGAIHGFVLKTGIEVGQADEGWLEDSHFNTNAWLRADGLPGQLSDATTTAVLLPYVQTHLHAFMVMSGAQHEHLVNDFVFASQTGFTFQGNARADGINLAVDGSTNSFAITGSTNSGDILLNLQGCGCGLGGVGLAMTGGVARIYDLLTLADQPQALSIAGGTYQIAGAAFNKGAAVITGGTGALEGVSFQLPGTQVTVEGMNTIANLWGNVGEGGFTDAFLSNAQQLYTGNIPR
jgi:hypothetical protein